MLVLISVFAGLVKHDVRPSRAGRPCLRYSRSTLPVLGAAGWVRALGEACPAQASPIALVPGSSVLSEDIVFLLLVSTAGRSRSQSEGPARVAE